jgi:hypothetical protein
MTSRPLTTAIRYACHRLNIGKEHAMGCWAIDSFGNDDAADWLSELTAAADLTPARRTVSALLSEAGYLDAPYSTEALAAIEVVAAALGRPTPSARSQSSLMTWVAHVKPIADASLVSDSARAIERILGPDSELRELWEDTDDFGEWQINVEQLRAALRG